MRGAKSLEHNYMVKVLQFGIFFIILQKKHGTYKNFYIIRKIYFFKYFELDLNYKEISKGQNPFYNQLFNLEECLRGIKKTAC